MHLVESRGALHHEQPYVLSEEDIGSDVARRVITRLLERSKCADRPILAEVVEETIYTEQLRLAHAEPDPRTASDHEFINGIRHEFAASDEVRCRKLVRSIVERYTHEIAGHFDRRVYGITTHILPRALSLLLHSPQTPRPFDIDDRIVVDGEVTALRALTRVGTVMLVPTHVSNLDSIVLGSLLYRLRLPPFAYGAGLNLFSNALIGFFMRHLGAYTVDRKKTDPLYRETLKAYVTTLLERGQHNLLFPGGTRSRSGAIECKLKKGLLGTAPVAFRGALQSAAARPRVFVVPCTLTYPLVLEASSLIGDYLRSEGGPRYVDVRDEFDNPLRWIDFFLSLRRLDERVQVRISRPLDWLGNDVDEHGDSFDARGRALDPSRYLLVNGQYVADDLRDAEYTRLLATRIVSAYRCDNVAVPTSVVAFVLFDRIRRQREHQDLFRFLRTLGSECDVRVDELLADLSRALEQIRHLEAQGGIRSSNELRHMTPESVLNQALTTFATYHPVPVIRRDGNKLHVGDPELLFYYRNRLKGYGLLATPKLLPVAQPSPRRQS